MYTCDTSPLLVQVVIEATFVDLEPLFDTLTVVDGGGLLASIGAPQKVTLIQEGTSPMRLKFKSDASFRYKGFFLEYQTEPPAAITEAEQAYNVTFAIIVTGKHYHNMCCAQLDTSAT